MVFSATVQDAWPPGDSDPEAALLEPCPAPAAARIGLQAASQRRAWRASMPIPTGGNPPGTRGTGAAGGGLRHGAPGDAGDGTMLPTLSA